MARHNLRWDSLSTDWYSGAFVGNGLIGAMVYRESENALRWDIGRSDVADHRKDIDTEWGKARLPIGRFVLQTVGKIRETRAELDLWNAEIRGEIITDKGTIHWRTFTATTPAVLVTETKATAGEAMFIWAWLPERSESPRLLSDKKTNRYTSSFSPTYQLAPKPNNRDSLGVHLHEQPYLNGGGFTTAWQEVPMQKANGIVGRILFVSVGNGFPQLTATPEAVSTIRQSRQLGVANLQKHHRAWWHGYYPQSFVSLPDTRLESYYWIQLYKLASATRANHLMLDLLGPWYHPTPWPALWWNLNVQLTYSPVYSSNRLHLGESLCNTIDRNTAAFIANVPARYQHDAAGISRVSSYDCLAPLDVEADSLHQKFKEAGNLTWALHNYWRQCRYAADNQRMQKKLFPLLRRSINYYRHLLHEEPDGRLHLPPTYSPEYTALPYADCNYDLSLLRWGCQTLLDLNRHYDLRDSLAIRWQDILTRLVEYQHDSTGLTIGRNTPLAFSHRHYSHLLMIYPLQTLKPSDSEKRGLIEKSLRHWTGMEGSLQGYTSTGAASMSALLGRGDNAVLRYLNELVDRFSPPNTFYREAGPVIETPFSAVASLNELLLQSHDSTIWVFPALPTSWKEVTFDKLRAEGAFLVSARRRGGHTEWIQITSLSGEPVRLRTDLQSPVFRMGNQTPSCLHRPDGSWELPLKKGERLLIYEAGYSPKYLVEPVPAQQGYTNLFGLHGPENTGISD